MQSDQNDCPQSNNQIDCNESESGLFSEKSQSSYENYRNQTNGYVPKNRLLSHEQLGPSYDQPNFPQNTPRQTNSKEQIQTEVTTKDNITTSTKVKNISKQRNTDDALPEEMDNTDNIFQSIHKRPFMIISGDIYDKHNKRERMKQYIDRDYNKIIGGSEMNFIMNKALPIQKQGLSKAQIKKYHKCFRDREWHMQRLGFDYFQQIRTYDETRDMGDKRERLYNMFSSDKFVFDLMLVPENKSELKRSRLTTMQILYDLNAIPYFAVVPPYFAKNKPFQKIHELFFYQKQEEEEL